MDGVAKLDWSALLELMPLCLKCRGQFLQGEDVDLREVAEGVGAAFGVDDIDKFAAQKLGAAMRDGFGQGFDGQSADALASIFAANAKPVMSLVIEFARGQTDSRKFVTSLNGLYLENAASLESVLQQVLGVPAELAELLAQKLGPYLVSMYAFAAAYKIYACAAADAQLARDRRVEIERLASEAIEQLQKQRTEMEDFVDACLLNRLEPFQEGLSAASQALLDDDDDAYIAASAKLWDIFGRESQYGNAREFDDLILSEEVFKL